jgi:hypothetical protein
VPVASPAVNGSKNACLVVVLELATDTKPALPVVSSFTLAGSRFIDLTSLISSCFDSPEPAILSLFCTASLPARQGPAHAYSTVDTQTLTAGIFPAEVVTIGHRDSHINRWRLIHSQHVTEKETPHAPPAHLSESQETPIKTALRPCIARRPSPIFQLPHPTVLTYSPYRYDLHCQPNPP